MAEDNRKLDRITGSTGYPVDPVWNILKIIHEFHKFPLDWNLWEEWVMLQWARIYSL